MNYCLGTQNGTKENVMDTLESDTEETEAGKQIVLFANWVEPRDRTTLSVLILDRSGSMKEYGDAPIKAVNDHIRKLQEAADGCNYLFGLVSFADAPRLEIDITDVKRIELLQAIECDGQTLLYETVWRTINLLYNRYLNLTDREQSLLKVVIGVISDGADNQSPSSQPGRLKNLAELVRSFGWETLVFGIGVSGKVLAEKMGFTVDDQHAFDLAADRSSLNASSITLTQTTLGGWTAKDHDHDSGSV